MTSSKRMLRSSQEGPIESPLKVPRFPPACRKLNESEISCMAMAMQFGNFLVHHSRFPVNISPVKIEMEFIFIEPKSQLTIKCKQFFRESDVVRIFGYFENDDFGPMLAILPTKEKARVTKAKMLGASVLNPDSDISVEKRIIIVLETCLHLKNTIETILQSWKDTQNQAIFHSIDKSQFKTILGEAGIIDTVLKLRNSATTAPSNVTQRSSINFHKAFSWTLPPEEKVPQNRLPVSPGPVMSQSPTSSLHPMEDEPPPSFSTSKSSSVITPPVLSIDDNSGEEESSAQYSSMASPLVLHFECVFTSVDIRTVDLCCLAEDELLNDKIVNFCCAYLINQKNAVGPLQNQLYYFNTFFYTILTRKTVKNSLLSVAQRRYLNVCRWTKRIDIFSKRFIVMPINFESHWVLAIICDPTFCLSQLSELSNPPRMSTFRIVQKYGELTGSTIALAPGSEHPTLSEVSANRFTTILLFDSLYSDPLNGIANNIKSYLIEEWKGKNPRSEFGVDRTRIKIVYPELPQQTNSTDCGLYLIKYLQKFLVSLPPYIDTPLDWSGMFKPDDITPMRERIKSVIQNLASQRDQMDSSQSTTSELMQSPDTLPDVIPKTGSDVANVIQIAETP